MGRNLGGGGNHKKHGRKHAKSGDKTGRLRESASTDEIYGVATKLLGNNMFDVYCVDRAKRVCHIAGKFSGRSKRQNMVTVGTWVLVGLNDFTLGTRSSKLEGCELLEVYTDAEKRQLQTTVVEDWVVLADNDPCAQRGAIVAEKDRFDFCNDDEMERQEFIAQTRAAIDVPNEEKETEPEKAMFGESAAAVDVDDI
jgi:translation initiation factor IF-1